MADRPLTAAELAELDRLAKAATPGPWVLWDGCSWRRFGSLATNSTVIEPTKNPHDGHPDLILHEEDAAFVVAARQAVPRLLADLAEARRERGEARTFPLQPDRGVRPGPLRIPWAIAEEAYSAYAAEFGRSQSLERLAERGGFGWGEMDDLLPGWRVRVDALVQLRATLAARDRRIAELRELLNRCIGLGPASERDRAAVFAAEREKQT